MEIKVTGEHRNNEPCSTVGCTLQSAGLERKSLNAPHPRGRCSPWRKSFRKVFSSVKRQPFWSTFRVIFSCEQSRGILPLGRNCCQTVIGEKDAYCWTPVHFRSLSACSFLCCKDPLLQKGLQSMCSIPSSSSMPGHQRWFASEP